LSGQPLNERFESAHRRIEYGHAELIAAANVRLLSKMCLEDSCLPDPLLPGGFANVFPLKN
jgi:hypothetical protein